MSLAQTLNPQTVDPKIPLDLAKQVAAKIRSVVATDRIILFGSAADGRFHVGSDLDILMVFPDLPSLKHGRTAIRSIRPLHNSTPVDLIFVSRERFDRQKDIGGVCFIADREGIDL